MREKSTRWFYWVKIKTSTVQTKNWSLAASLGSEKMKTDTWPLFRLPWGPRLSGDSDSYPRTCLLLPSLIPATARLRWLPITSPIPSQPSISPGPAEIAIAGLQPASPTTAVWVVMNHVCSFPTSSHPSHETKTFPCKVWFAVFSFLANAIEIHQLDREQKLINSLVNVLIFIHLSRLAETCSHISWMAPRLKAQIIQSILMYFNVHVRILMKVKSRHVL